MTRREATEAPEPLPRVVELLDREGLIETRGAADGGPVGDLTREPLTFPARRDVRLQNLARGDEGFLLAMGYATQRGYGRNHPFAGEIRHGRGGGRAGPGGARVRGGDRRRSP